MKDDKYKEHHTKYKEMLENLEKKKKSITASLGEYKKAIKDNKDSLELGNKIKGDLDNCIKVIGELKDDYKDENLPNGFPQQQAEKRLAEIKGLEISYEEMSKNYIELTNEKLSFKDFITEDYRNKEEYQNKSTEQLQQIQKEKLGEQNEIIDNIIVDTKKGTQIAKNIHHEIGEQNKVIGQISQDMEMVDTRMNKLTKRFNEYTKKSSTCCLCLFFWCDAIVFGLLVWIYTCVNESGWHC